MKLMFGLMVLFALLGLVLGLVWNMIVLELPVLLGLWLAIKGWAAIGAVLGALVGAMWNNR